MLSFIRQILEWVPDARPALRRALVYKLLESICMGAPFGIAFLFLFGLVHHQLTGTKIVVYTLGILFCFAMQILFSSLFFGLIWPTANHVVKTLRLRAGEHLHSLPMSYFSTQNTGTLHTLAVEELQQIQNALTRALPDTMVALTFMVMGPLAFAFIDWRLALAVIAVYPLILLVYVWGTRTSTHQMQRRSSMLVKVNSKLFEYIQGIEVFKAFARTENRLGKLDNLLRKFRDVNISVVRHETPPGMTGKLLLDIAFCVTLLFSTLFLIQGSVSLTIFLMFLIWCLRLYEPVKLLFPALLILKVAEPGLKGMQRLLAQNPLPVLPPAQHGTDTAMEETRIDFENVTFTYNAEEARPALKNVSFSVRENTMTALVGPSGSGKTTITRLLARFWNVDSGCIRIGGKDIRSLTSPELFSKLGMVFQDVYLFNDTIARNIAYGLDNATPDQVEAAAKMAQCHEFISRLPQGYDTSVGEGGSTLSGGEKQRVSIARAILRDAPILLLDEATASVDSGNEHLIQGALNALIGSKTLLVIAHRLSTIVEADQIVVLNKNGEVDDTGTHQELLKRGGLYAKLWQERVMSQSWRIQTNEKDEPPAASPHPQPEKPVPSQES